MIIVPVVGRAILGVALIALLPCTLTSRAPGSTGSSFQYGTVSASAPVSGAQSNEIIIPSSNPSAVTLDSASYRAQLGTGAHRWRQFPVRVAFVHDENDTPQREGAAARGFDEWVSATGSHVSYRVVADPRDADITVRFDLQGDRSRTDTDFIQNRLTHASMCFGLVDPENSGSLVDSPTLSSLGAHEFGHALGIDGHSDSAQDVMYPSVDSQVKVTSRDVNTLRAVYAAGGEKPSI